MGSTLILILASLISVHAADCNWYLKFKRGKRWVQVGPLKAVKLWRRMTEKSNHQEFRVFHTTKTGDWITSNDGARDGAFDKARNIAHEASLNAQIAALDRFERFRENDMLTSSDEEKEKDLKELHDRSFLEDELKKVKNGLKLFNLLEKMADKELSLSEIKELKRELEEVEKKRVHPLDLRYLKPVKG